MSSVFPLKAILETRSARFLQDVSDVDSKNPQLKKKINGYGGIPKRSVSIMSTKSSFSESYLDDTCLERKNKVIHCLAMIVEDAIDQMHILSSGKKSENCLRQFKLSLKERLAGTLYEDPIYDMETGDPYNVAFAKRKLSKNLDDCAVCKEFLIIIKNELRSEKSYTSVGDIMNTIIKTKEAEMKLLTDEATNHSKMKDYKLMLITHSRDYQLQMQAVNEILASSEDRTQELLFENLLRIRYIKSWEKARQEQNTLSCKKSEQELEDIIKKYQFEIEKEIRIHTEIETFISENLTDLESGIKYWIARYDKEMESKNIQVQLIRDHKEEQEKQFQILKEIFALHKKEIKDFKAYKERERIAAEERARQTVAAIKIQAWWRGNMVRHKLGPFNPKRKGKKGKGKNKNKKKK